jgi:hypothetical protein
MTALKPIPSRRRIEGVCIAARCCIPGNLGLARGERASLDESTIDLGGRTPHRPGACGATPPRERRGAIPLLFTKGWHAKRDGAVREAQWSVRRLPGSAFMNSAG